MVGGTSSSGTARTVGVCGAYWISSNTSVRRTTAPGLTPRLPPTAKADVSTICGIRGGWARSFTRFSPPRTKLSPPDSRAARTDSGLTTATLLGASAWSRLSARNRTRWSSRQPSSAPVISSSTVRPVARYVCRIRRSTGLLCHCGSAKRRSFGPGPSSELPRTTRSSSAASPPSPEAVVPGRVASRPASLTVDRSGASRRIGPKAASISSASSGTARSSTSVIAGRPARGSPA